MKHLRYSESAYTLFADYYDRRSSIAAKGELADYLLTMQAGTVRVALDLCCGTGNSFMTLAKRGVRVIGVDRSLMMLDIARAKSANAGLDVSLICCDVESLELGGSQFADLIQAQSFSLNYLSSPDALVRLLKKCRGWMTTRGLLMFDFLRPDCFDSHFLDLTWLTANGRVTARIITEDARKALVSYEFFSPSGEFVGRETHHLVKFSNDSVRSLALSLGYHSVSFETEIGSMLPADRFALVLRL